GTDVNIDNPLAECVDIHPVHRQEMDNLTILKTTVTLKKSTGEPNRLNRIYHSGETEDGAWFLRWLQREFGAVPTAAVGYSLGG
ncbi:DUF2195 family protein, partial [Salmonella enterica subsp. enterica serovar Anatum]|nr:DUF2195 family protein [Salmonella enterica subsp. enterica serovar Anatum]